MKKFLSLIVSYLLLIIAFLLISSISFYCVLLYDWHENVPGYLYLIGAVVLSIILLYLSDKIKCIACHHKHDHIALLQLLFFLPLLSKLKIFHIISLAKEARKNGRIIFPIQGNKMPSRFE